MRFIDYRKENSPNTQVEPRKEREREEMEALLKIYFANGGKPKKGKKLKLDRARKPCGFGMRWRDEY